MGESAYTKVMILGEEYRVSGDTSGAAVLELAAFVDDRMAEVKRRSHRFDLKRIAVLTALNLADELFLERARSETLLGQVKGRVEELGSALEEALADRGEGAGSLD